MLRRSSYLTVLVAGLAAAPLAGQGPADTARAIARLHQRIHTLGVTVGPAIWPESIPTLYVIPRRAKVLLAWRDSTLEGFGPLSGAPGALWTDTQAVSLPSDRFIAFLSVAAGATAADVLGLALHEEFHSFEHMSRREGRRFGSGENAMRVGDYPVFDADNEALWAVEGRLLLRAYRSRSAAETRVFARRFLAVRALRQARLDSSFAEFERMGEINEGLAQYALLHGETEIGRALGGVWATDAARAVAEETALLDSLLSGTTLSVRRRFYATGSTMSLLLDRLAGPAWKRALVADDRTLQDELSLVVESGGPRALGPAWEDSLGAMRRAAQAEAERAVASLRARRLAQVDSILAEPGLLIVLAAAGLPRHRFDMCGFDPQNTLQTGDGRTLHMRFVALCAGDSVSATFSQPVIEDGHTGDYRTVIADAASLAIMAGAGPLALPDTGSVEATALRIDSPTFTLRAPHATVTRLAGELRIAPRP